VYDTSLASANITTNTTIIAAPLGIFTRYDASNPTKVPIKLMAMDHLIIPLNVFVKKLAVAGGMENNDISRIIPTTLMLSTMAAAISAVRMYCTTFTGTF